MSTEVFLNGRVTLHGGDCREVLKTLADHSIHSIVCDPPYALVSIVKRFANSPRNERTENTENPYGRTGRGFMGQRWDNGETAFAVEFWQECLRVLKPGGHVVAFSGTRTYHRMACAIEDAGFEIRDQLQWVYGSGFPKSHDVSKGIDKAAGAERTEIIGSYKTGEGANFKHSGGGKEQFHEAAAKDILITAPATDSAIQWQGWGTALKPACEPICFARKPLIGTVAANVLAHGTGAINIDGCRVGYEPDADMRLETRGVHASTVSYDGLSENGGAFGGLPAGRVIAAPNNAGRWPANLLHDGSDEVIAAFPAESSVTGARTNRSKSASVTGTAWLSDNHESREHTDSGSPARFFYSAKADSTDRLGSRHPTVKPVDLMQWLVRLVTPAGGVCLDPFAGTGTTAEACFREGMRCVLIEREEEYQTDIRRRMALCMAGPDERKRESIKAKTQDQAEDHGPLFSNLTDPPQAA